ncbi:MAG: hypothetical protein AB7K24_03710, partial [Gemmataceae bacterium]
MKQRFRRIREGGDVVLARQRGDAVVGQSLMRRLLITLLVLGCVIWTGLSWLPAQTLRLSRDIPGDFKSITLHADEIASWVEGSQRIFLLKGVVLVQQGTAQVRMERAVGWTDLAETQKTNITRLDLYAEGDVRIENGTEAKSGEKAIIDLNTRGEVQVKSQKGKILQKNLSSDPFYQRALAERSALNQAPAAKTENPIQQTSFQETTAATPLPEQPTRPAPPVSNQPLPVVPEAAAPTPPTSRPPSSSSYQPLPLPGAAPAPTAPTNPSSPVPVQTPILPLPRVEPQGPRAGGTTPPLRQIRIVPRTSAPFQVQEIPLANGEKAFVVTGGVILTVSDPRNEDAVTDIEADRLVIWTKDDPAKLFRGLRTEQGSSARDAEVYLSGNVQIFEQSGRKRGPDKTAKDPNRPSDDDGLENHRLQADEVYYDLARNVAIAYQADLSFRQSGVPDPIHMKADELLQLSRTKFQAVRAEVFSSKLPSDPGLKVFVSDATLEQKVIPKRSIFGREVLDRETGQPLTETQRYFDGNNVFVELGDVPVLYFPYLRGDVNDPLGPLENVRLAYNRIYGGWFSFTLDIYDLLGIDPPPGTRWDLDIDYLTRRGPALGTEFEYSGRDFFGLPGLNVGRALAWGLRDASNDILGGGRGDFQSHPLWRGRILWNHFQELPADFQLQMQASVLSDKNFLEQYYYNEFNRGINQETFIYLKQQRDFWAWTAIAEPRIRTWVNETQRLPELTGHLIGVSWFDLVTYNARASAGYLDLKTSNVLPPPLEPTTVNADAGRFDLWQDVSLPFYLGPVKLAPYGVVDLTSYTQDLNGDATGRFYGGGGARASMPLSRLYPSAASDIFNVNGIYHKVVFGGNYYNVYSDTPFSELPQFDRLHDDASDQSIRDLNQPFAPGLIPRQFSYNPANAFNLINNPLFNPQTYAIRRLATSRVDTLDTIQVLQGDIRQRWQTKRGYPGQQHIVDWMVLDTSTSFFPAANRDNFGVSFAFWEYAGW